MDNSIENYKSEATKKPYKHFLENVEEVVGPKLPRSLEDSLIFDIANAVKTKKIDKMATLCPQSLERQGSSIVRALHDKKKLLADQIV